MSDKKKKLPTTFPLRLPTSTRKDAIELAERDGISLNHFIAIAVAERIARTESKPEQTKILPMKGRK